MINHLFQILLPVHFLLALIDLPVYRVLFLVFDIVQSLSFQHDNLLLADYQIDLFCHLIGQFLLTAKYVFKLSSFTPTGFVLFAFSTIDETSF